ncbi:hypothetical protein OK349_00425 [Sphingomonas sp. BT-65]|uniref:hypothetical protein n=1 Tax=Sphingomonas sp. BT-65 TaxID=2989821 RepID=UPI0022365BD9|nr:hypothetical protein [Sphingomonas sp. BT-65]MCW4460158.1 hypothetical protein [Sphingomonas sp. BT-65]
MPGTVYDDDPIFASLSDADAYAVTVDAELVIRKDHTLTENVVLGAKAVRMEGGKFVCGVYNITFLNDFECGGYQCFVLSGSGDRSTGGYQLNGKLVFRKGGLVVDARWFGAVADGNPNTDNALAITQACHVAAGEVSEPMTSAISSAIFLPAGTYYINSTIQLCRFAADDEPSAGPAQFFGEGYGSIIKAKSGMSGLMIFAKNMAGVTLRDFRVDGSNNAGLIWLDTSWWEVGPHQLNNYNDIVFENLNLSTSANGGNPGIGHEASNNNQTVFRNVTYRTNGDGTGVPLNIESSGGSLYLYDLTVDTGVVRLTCQNAGIFGGVYNGFEFCVEQTGNNAVTLEGAQSYSNVRTGAVFSSGSPGEAGHTVSSITIIGCQFPVKPDHCLFDVVLVTQINWIGSVCASGSDSPPVPADINMFGSSMSGPTDPTGANWNAKVLFKGGRAEHPARLVTNRSPANISVGKEDFQNYGAREHQGAADITRVVAGPFASGVTKSVLAAGVLTAGTYVARISYDHEGDGNPWALEAIVHFPVVLMSSTLGVDKDFDGAFVEHAGTGSKLSLRVVKPASDGLPGIDIVPSFTNAGTAQRATVEISRVL